MENLTNVTMDLIDQRNNKISEIKKAKKELAKLEKEYKKIDEEFQWKIGKTYSDVTIKTRKGSAILISPFGKSIYVPNKCNSHNERNIYWYDGAKKDIALTNCRMSINKLALWLKTV